MGATVRSGAGSISLAQPQEEGVEGAELRAYTHKEESHPIHTDSPTHNTCK